MTQIHKDIDWKHEWLYLLPVIITIFLVYIWSAPRTVVLEDDGLFILAAYFNGIAHPPGYPLYTLLSHVATYMPFGSIAFRVHVFSAFLGALACGVLWWACRLIMPGKLFAYTASFVYGFSNIFWSQAIIAEVYTLNVLLFLLIFVLCLKYKSIQSRSTLFITAFIYGLALSNHWPLIILSTPVLLCILWSARAHLIKNLPAIILFIVLGLTPYLWMVIRSQMDPVISFYGPINTLQDLIFIISRKGYELVDTSPSAGWFDKLLFSVFILKETARQFGFTGIAFIILGFIYQWRLWPAWLSLALLTGYLCNTFLLIFLLNFDYDLLHRSVIRVYPLIAYIVVVLWLALGVYKVIDILAKQDFFTLPKKYLQAGIFIFVSGVTFAENLPENFRANDLWMEDYARLILESLDENAILFADGDIVIGQVGYLHLVEGIRPDVTLYNSQGLIFSNRLFNTFSAEVTNIEKSIRKFVRNEDRPVYYMGEFPNDYGASNYGLYLKVNKKLPVNEHVAIINPLIKKYFLKLSRSEEPVDLWGAMHYRLMMGRICRISAIYYQLGGHTGQNAGRLNENCRNYYGILGYIAVLLDFKIQDQKFVDELLNTAIIMRDQSISKSDSSKPEYYRAEFLLRQGDYEGARQNFRYAIQRWPHPENPAIKRLKEITSENEIK